MTVYKTNSYAKINLSLEVISKREDSYHEIDSLMTKVFLHDEIFIEKFPGENLILESNTENFPTDEKNLIYKAWSILKKYYKEDSGLKIFVDKNIFISAGLAGGTSNACEVLKSLNKIWNLNFDNEKLLEIAKPLGADSSFFFYDGIVRARGIGEKIEPLNIKFSQPVLLVNPGIEISSREVYKNIKNYSCGKVQKIYENLKNGNENYLFENAFNSMEEVSFKNFFELSKIKKDLKTFGADMALMSGSGATVFGIFKDENLLDIAYNSFLKKYKYVIKTRTW